VDYSALEAPLLEEDRLWQALRDFALALAIAAVLLATVAVTVAAVLVHYS
jgi:type IV secretory pathway component VirB8